LCDADLDYLGKDGYDQIALTLKKEMEENGYEFDELAWLDIQISFLERHRYFTPFSLKHRDTKKLEVVHALKAKRALLERP